MGKRPLPNTSLGTWQIISTFNMLDRSTHVYALSTSREKNKMSSLSYESTIILIISSKFDNEQNRN